MIIRQEVLFSFEELQKCEPKSSIEILMDNLDVTSCVPKLPVHTLGRRPYPHAAMIRALVAMRLLSIPTVSALVERLLYDIRLRHACGFDAAHRAPAGSKFSRFHKMLSENDGLHRLFDALVQQCWNLGIADGETVAIDSSALRAYEHPLPKRKHPKDGQQADWGHKKDSYGNPMDWHGYKLHTAVDAKSGLLGLRQEGRRAEVSLSACPRQGGLPAGQQLVLGIELRMCRKEARPRRSPKCLPAAPWEKGMGTTI